jgi:hypothetical protein
MPAYRGHVDHHPVGIVEGEGPHGDRLGQLDHKAGTVRVLADPGAHHHGLFCGRYSRFGLRPGLLEDPGDDVIDRLGGVSLRSLSHGRSDQKAGCGRQDAKP